MMFIDYILDWARARGYVALYGSAYQLNDFMTDADYAAATDETAIYCHLITAMESVNGHDRAEVAIYFARLCDFDFNPEGLLSVQDELKEISKSFLNCVSEGNAVRYLFTPRWQFGYDDFAENVCWCCLRVTLEDMAGDCVPMGGGCPEPEPEPEPEEI